MDNLLILLNTPRLFELKTVQSTHPDSFSFLNEQEVKTLGQRNLKCINAESREKVDEMFNKAISLGGNSYRPAQDHGFMYAQAFQDLDGHIWEVMWMDPKAAEA